MEKLEKIEFHTASEPAPGLQGSGYKFVLAREAPRFSIRTKSEKEWPREAYLDKGEDKENLHFIAYDPESDSYLLETAVRMGKGYERREARMTVEDIKARNGGSNPDSTQHVVEIMSEDLTCTTDWVYPPAGPPLERSNPPIERGDILENVRGARGLKPKQRDIIREMLKRGAVKQDQLPEGVVTVIAPVFEGEVQS